MNRSEMLERLRTRREPWDIVVVGGGATGAGIAVDAAARGYEVLLVERGDFGCGTSSRSTKLVHGGVRYLQQGHIGLVFEALHERGRLRANAPHLVHDLGFVLPCYRFGQRLFYGLGLKTYDYLAGRYGFGNTRFLSKAATIEHLPTIQPNKLRGGVLYHDGQFDDARLLIHLIMTAAGLGAVTLNYVEVHGLTKADGSIRGVLARDRETGEEFRAAAKVVINAAGPFCDELRTMADANASSMVAASQGSHVVLDRSFLPGNSALLVPSTPDGRVLFAIPWHGHTLVGTTDIALPHAPVEPRCTDEEMHFILETAGRYLTRPPRAEDVLCTFAGVRPLVKAGDGRSTSKLSRDFSIREDQPGMLTIAGGKWTTYRAMAEACVNRAAALAKLPEMPCPTKELSLHGYHQNAAEFGDLAGYGSDAIEIRKMVADDAKLGERLHPALPYIAAEVVWAVRHEMARTVDDVLSRRLRASFLKSAAAREMAPRVAEWMQMGLSGIGFRGRE